MKQTILYFLFASLFLFTSCNEENICIMDENLTTESSSVSELSTGTWGLYTDIVIDASAEEVWSVLTNFSNMSNWSSSLQGLVGDIRNGGMVTLTYSSTDAATGVVTTSQFDRTLVYQEGVLFGWSEPFELAAGTGIFIDDNHQFRVEAISDCQARFIQTDDFTGSIPAAAGITLEQVAGLVEGVYQKFNQELKGEVEK